MTKYPTVWQRKMMWAALTTVFVVLLVTIGVFDHLVCRESRWVSPTDPHPGSDRGYSGLPP